MNLRWARLLQSLSALLGVFVALFPAFAADHNNLEENLPVRVEDAYTLAKGARELQVGGRYQRIRGSGDQYVAIPRFEYGFARNWQVTLASSLLAGPADRKGSGDTELEVLHNFNTEGLILPAFALSGRADFPSGIDSNGVDTRVKFITTKTLGNSYFLHRVHVNAEYLHNAGRLDGERSDRYAVVAGYQARLSTSNMLIADILREQQIDKGIVYNIAEVGLRHQFTPQTVFGLGVGTGFGPDSPRFRVTVSLQHDFGAHF